MTLLPDHTPESDALRTGLFTASAARIEFRDDDDRTPADDARTIFGSTDPKETPNG